MEQTINNIINNGAKEGNRNNAFFRAACHFKRKGLPSEIIKERLDEINKKTNPPLQERELNSILDSSEKYTFEKHPFEAFGMLNIIRDFVEKHPIFYDRSRMWWLWDQKESSWINVDATDLFNKYECYHPAQQLSRNQIQQEIINALKMVGRANMPIIPKTKYIQFKNLVFNLEDKQLYEVENRFFFSNPIPWELGENSNTPIMDELFEEWVGKEYVQTLYEIIAYCCYRSYPIQTLFCFVGRGRNGKTQFQRIISKFLGDRNICCSDLDAIAGNHYNRFESFNLYKKLCCVLGETNFGLLSNTTLLKKLVGGDLVNFEKKNCDPFTDYNYAKIIINSNSLPSSNDNSDGFYRRWLILEWKNEFKEGRDIFERIPDVEFNNLARKVIEILPVLLERGSFTGQGSIEERKKKYIEVSNPFSLFLEQECEREINLYVSLNFLFAKYKDYLTKNKRRLITRKEFHDALTLEGLYGRKTTFDGINDWYVEGVSVKKC